jgi:hypothetical protein
MWVEVVNAEALAPRPAFLYRHQLGRPHSLFKYDE